MKRKFHIAGCFALLSSFAFAQSSTPTLTITNQTITNQNKYAQDVVVFLPQSTASVTAGNTSRLYIDKTIQLPASYSSSGVNYSNTIPPIDYTLPVGATAGTGNVTSSGQATYNIPISLPPGTKGMVPTLGISYNSGSPDGILGRGWNVNGISAITRVPKDIYRDGAKVGIQLSNASDVYALDGIRIIGNVTTGAARLESDNFSKITFISSTYFKVETKDGITMEYGNTYDSKLMASSPNVAIAWYLSSTYDKYGNYISYLYDNNTTNNEVVLREIQYTGNTAAGIQPYNFVKFYYDVRTDATTRYILNNSFKNTLILREIEVSCESNFMKRLQFQYGYDSQSFLNSITEQGSDYSKLNTTFIKYGENVTSPNTVSVSQPSGLTANADYIAGDFNGDGKSDLIAFTYSQIFTNGTKTYTGWELYINQDDGATFTKTPNSLLTQLPANFFPFSLPDFMSESSYTIPAPFGMQVVDFNGDGKDDILIGFFASGKKNFRVYYSTGSNFTAGTNTFFTENSYPFTLADIDGDSKIEGIAFNPVGPSFSIYSFETGQTTYITSFNPVVNPTYQGLSTTDFDGDGISELITTRGGLLVVLKLNKTTLNSTEKYSSVLPSFYRQDYFGDFNGDGIMDKVKVDDPSSGAVATQWLGTGTDFSVSTSMTGVSHFSTIRKYITIDINNDGKTDFIELSKTITPDINFNVSYGGNPTAPRTLLGTLNAMSFPNVVDYNYDDPNDPVYPPLQETNPNLVPEFLTGDFDGDGRADIFFKTASSGQRAIAYINKSSTKQLATVISNGFKLNTNFKYATLANGGSNVYVKGSGAIFPVADFQAPVYVAKEVSIQDGIGGNTISTYKYEGATVHVQGKGVLGFDKVTTISVNNAIPSAKTVNTYTLNATFYEKIPSNTQIYSYPISSYVLRSEIAYTPLLQATNGKAHFTVMDKTESKDLLSGKMVTVDPTYDSNGNITQHTTTIRDAYFNAVPIETTLVEMPNYIQAGSWLPNVATTQTTTITRSEDASNPYKRTINYSYNITTGALNQTLSDGNDLNFSVLTDYEYEANTGVLTKQEINSAEYDLPYTLPTRAVEFTYETKKRFVTQTKNPLGQFSYATYDPRWGKPLTETDITGLVTSYSYDGYGRNTSVTTPDNLTSTTTYAWAKTGSPGALTLSNYTPTTFDTYVTSNALYSITAQRPGSPNARTIYDTYGRELATETDGFATKIYTANKYDARGNIEKSCGTYQNPVTLAPVITTNTYNDLNQITSSRSVSANITTPPATTFAYTYAPADLSFGFTTITTTSPDGKVFKKIIDASGLLFSAQDNGGTLTYTYYSNRQLKQTKLAGVTTNTMEYDVIGRQKKLTEANSGVTEYKYDAYGELVYQKDANGNESKFEYNDMLGRMTAKTCTTATNSVSTYGFSYVTSGSGLNMLQSMTGPDNISYSYTYDNLNRVTSKSQNINGSVFSTSYEYDQFSNLYKQTYPSGFAIKHTYNTSGYHTHVNRADNNSLIYQVDEINSLGQYNKYTLGNGVQTVKAYTDFGFPTTCVATGIQNMQYDFNPINGNLNSRTDATVGLTETFTYDNLDRLKTTSGPSGTTVNFSNNGNILNKSDAGTSNYVYHNAKINAVVQIPLPNLTSISDIQQDIVYTPFNKVKTITEGINQLNFTYGPDYERKKTILLNTQTGSTSTRYFLSDYEKTVEQPSGITTEVHYISSGSGLVGIYVITNGSGSMYYPYTDHLGSIVKVMNGTNGAVAATQSFDAWGRSRNPVDWTYNSIPSVPTWLYRGYTGHEHLSEFALINMNGRMYDPIVGRMLSPDIFVSDATITQSHNRYSYVANNPLKFVDPDGNFAMLAALGVFVVGSTIDHLLNDNIKTWDDIGSSIKQGTQEGLHAMSEINSVVKIPIYQDDKVSLSISPSLVGLGVNLNASYKTGDWTIGTSFGSSLGVKGWEPTFGGGATYYDKANNIGFSLGAMNFMGSDPQWNWIAGIRSGNFSFTTTNDIGISPGDKGRTAAAEVGVGDYSFGMNLYSTEHSGGTDASGPNEWKSPIWGCNGKGRGTYSIGSRITSNMYLGYKNGGVSYRAGINAPFVQDLFQNGIHRHLSNSPYFKTDYGTPWKPYFFGNPTNPFTLY